MQEQKKSSLVVTLLIILIVAVLAVGGYLVFGSNIKGLSMGDKTATSTLFTSGSTANVATVNGIAITKAVYDSAFTSTIASYQAQGIQATSSDDLAKVRTQVLDGLIGNELLAQALTASKMTVTPAEVDTEYQALVTQSGGAEGFKTALTKNNLTDAQLRMNIEKQILTRKFLLSNIDTKLTTVTDAEIAKFYSEYSASQIASGNKSVQALKTLSAQIKQQLTGDKEQALINKFIATLRASADVVITQ